MKQKLPELVHLKLTGNLQVDGMASGAYVDDIQVGENVNAGDALYFSGRKWRRADASSTTTMPCSGLALEGVLANQLCKVLLLGFYRNDSWAYVEGGILYVSTNSGPLTQTAPSGSGDQVQIGGVAYTKTIILFNPSYELVEIA